jgi:hypothetical protein
MIPFGLAEIIQIPIDYEMEDLPAWHFDAKGLFMAKSGYKVAVSKGMQRQARMLQLLGA